MKLKDVFLGVLIVALIASEILLFSANQQKRDAIGKLSAAQHDLLQAQTELDQTKTADAATIASTRADNQSLTQKYLQSQGDNKKLRAENDKLNQQLGTAREAVQLQQQHLDQLQTQPEQQSATTSADAERDACINNLSQIDAAKHEWALELNKTANDIPTAQDLLVYLPGGTFPVCPSGGTYTIGAVGVAPTCSIPGHVLPVVPQQ
jgi:predicted RNase H-like nuclease (RuvC/YqgF family)